MMTSREDRIASMESMSDRQSSTPEAAERVIHNPVSGERIVIRTTAAQTDGRLLVFDLSLPPGGHVPARHAHPSQEERFTVIEGHMRFRFAGKTCAVNPGESVVVPKGQPHWFGNPGKRDDRSSRPFPWYPTASPFGSGRRPARVRA